MINALFTAFALIAAGQGVAADSGRASAGLERAREAPTTAVAARRARQPRPGDRA